MATTADVIVIGAGVIGLTVARELRQSGLRVLMIDRDLPGRQASWASAGIVGEHGPGAGDPLSRLGRLSVQIYPELAERLAAETGMDVEYRRNGHLIPAFSEADAAVLDRSAAQARAEGVASEVVRGAALREAEPALGPRIVAAQLLPGGNVENRRLVRALELAERHAGTRVMAGVVATSILSDGDRAVGVRTHQGDLHGSVIVNAAGSWAAQFAESLAVVPQRGQILALRGDEAGLKRVILKPGDPYLVPRVDGRIVVGATREFVGYDASLTAGGVAWLLQSAIEMVPALADAPVVEMWTGFRPYSLDGLPIVGESTLRGLYHATGHGPSGITHAPGTARLLAALIRGEPPPIPPEPYSPQRFS